MIVNINDAKNDNNNKKKTGWKMFSTWKFFKTLSLSFTLTKVKKYSQTNTAAVNPQQLKVQVAE